MLSLQYYYSRSEWVEIPDLTNTLLKDISRKFLSDYHTPFLIGLAREKAYLCVFGESFD